MPARYTIMTMGQDFIAAIAKGNTSRVREAIEALHRSELPEDKRHTVLMWTWFHGDVAALRLLIENGWQLSEIGADLGLNGACFHGHRDLVDYLLQQGANANFQQPETHETPLHSAICKAGRPQYNPIVELLLQHGANPNLATKPGVETGAFMRDTRTRAETPLHRAAAFGDEAMITLLLDAGADKTLRDANGDSPLSWASWHLRPGKILKLLAFEPWEVGEWHVRNLTSDHGKGWGNGMENKFV